ncbi:hypothetical protein L228DRAFT_237742 [Xylona heveae TC161]|uniref:Uncharacterized protein n=1 Tax=Xylona heveae (strain CBS 132557 / TC161) TaxID=1328760 RepID=A0A165H8W7_XYLHT|nr:hypothetical protein L228DRAFT_237742 [Xylona heveae TC161]KZF23148.1 hypothetical protein L228DRAFT_237742 [Xylona heveae TC161]
MNICCLSIVSLILYGLINDSFKTPVPAFIIFSIIVVKKVTRSLDSTMSFKCKAILLGKEMTKRYGSFLLLIIWNRAYCSFYISTWLSNAENLYCLPARIHHVDLNIGYMNAKIVNEVLALLLSIFITVIFSFDHLRVGLKNVIFKD